MGVQVDQDVAWQGGIGLWAAQVKLPVRASHKSGYEHVYIYILIRTSHKSGYEQVYIYILIRAYHKSGYGQVYIYILINSKSTFTY